MNNMIPCNSFSKQDLPEHHLNFMSLKCVDCDLLEELSTSSSDFEDDDIMSLTDSIHLAVDRGIHLSPKAAKKRNRRQLTEDDSVILAKKRVPLCVHANENKNDLTNDVEFVDADGDGFESDSETSSPSPPSGVKPATQFSEAQTRLARMLRQSSIKGSKTKRRSRKRQRTSAGDCMMTVLEL
mmetsp:Transcript_39481/g.95511  ORF Transcript_39481/g.95511 Transcript_39481/m.95511 type:complete len:183 (-) Transcript_39481:122-670(-)|eukprot:CAMPEP_0113626468 /NCGR_PEP_ID=MMETSP0017_2-20120614/13689_1 /TAXON_ID=2856 /ORGANISM="Cylindrotheca closterium" /LENGTH=182 /DNA_ID=CAMNT_0000536651 /DNA_START=55 /DNA_END=603 /DNA_ORIENTATION=- /assembly_acc=CAM_ASM_000147